MAENDSTRTQAIRANRLGLELRAADEGGGMPTLFGHFAVFNRWTEIDSWFEGRFLERIAPGAFRKTFRENRDRIRALFQHGRDPQIGDKPLGSVEDLREDDTGAYYEVDLLDTSYNRDLIPGLEKGLYGSSFRFEVIREDFPPEPADASEHNPNGLRERTLKELRLFEFGPVTFPAYADATADVRSLTDHFLFEQIEREPSRFRSLLERAIDLSASADDAPSVTDAGSTPTSGQERRASRDYLTPQEEATWQL
jgi:HK97 family phage prohead protease